MAFEFNSKILKLYETQTQKKDDAIFLHLNSGGGSVTAGLSIYDTLLEAPCKIVVRIEGRACSIASIIALAGEERIMSTNAHMLIHNLSTYYDGAIVPHHVAIEDLENSKRLMKVLKRIYLERSDISKEKLEELLIQDKNLSAKKCLKYGLVTHVIKIKTLKPEE